MKRQQNRILFQILLLACTIMYPLWSGTTGKIAGTVTDKATGETLIGINIIVEGTGLGAATDINGEYTILKVPPGTYQVHISGVGYRRATISDVRVFIDQTARIDVALESQTVELGETIITAERKLVKPDVSTSVVSYSDREIKMLPANNVIDVVNLQAGVNTGGAAAGGDTSRGPASLRLRDA